MIITIEPKQKNTTPKVIEALEQLKSAGGGELIFEKGEYHFYKEGAPEQFVAVTNNCSCIKSLIFPLINFESITVNGNGSVFVFHDITTPFCVYKSKNVIIKNIIFDRAFSPVANMKLKDKNDDGFMLEIDKTDSPYYVKDGHIVFVREWGELSTADKKLSLHMKGQHLVQYLFAGESLDSTKNLPASFMLTNASEVSGGVYFKYKKDTESKCVYEAETELYTLADGSGRESDVIILSNSENIKIKDITIRRGLGMGIVGQLCSNIEIDGLKTDRDYYKEHSTLTADCMHFVNCTGCIDIHDCNIEYISDDVLNIHGVYSSLKKKDENRILAELKHNAQRFFNPYNPGDILDIISYENYEVVSRFIVDNSEFVSEDGSLIEIRGSFASGFSDAEEGFLIENPKRMPDANIHNNKFNRFPHMRVSGAGRIMIKENEFSNCTSALLATDLAHYWMESGRINDLTFTKNRLENCTVTGRGSFICVGIGDVNESDVAKIHNRIEISDNVFYDIKDKAIASGGVKNLIIENNVYNTEKDGIISINGEVI